MAYFNMKEKAERTAAFEEQLSSIDKPTVKIVLVGDQAVGKSSLITRYTSGEFHEDIIATVGVEFFSKIVEISGGQEVRVQVWDTAGQEKHRSLTRQVFRGAKGVMLVYDVTNRRSFDNLSHWLNQIKHELHSTCSLFLVGNKCDLTTGTSASSSSSSSSPAGGSGCGNIGSGGGAGGFSTYGGGGSSDNNNNANPNSYAYTPNPTATDPKQITFISGAFGSTKTPLASASGAVGGNSTPTSYGTSDSRAGGGSSSGAGGNNYTSYKQKNGVVTGVNNYGGYNTTTYTTKSKNKYSYMGSSDGGGGNGDFSGHGTSSSSTSGGGKNGSGSGGGIVKTSMTISSRSGVNLRQVSLQEGDSYARKHGMVFMETSAKDLINVERAFHWLVQNVIETTLGEQSNSSYEGGGGRRGGGGTRSSVNLSGRDGGMRRRRNNNNNGGDGGDNSNKNGSDGDSSDDGRPSKCPC